MQLVFRRFGALASEATPCGKPVTLTYGHALMVLAASGALTQGALGAELGIDKSNVARLCAKMVEAGHVTQRRGEDDARSRHVALTPRGARLAKEVDTASRARFSALLLAIPATRRRPIVRAMSDLVRAIGTIGCAVALTVLVGCAQAPAQQAASGVAVVSASSRPVSQNLPAELDARRPVPLLPAMANHQKENMRDHLLAVQEITAALAREDFAAIEKSGARIGSSEPMARMCGHMGAGAPGFMDQALAFHVAADRIIEAAKAKDRARVTTELAATLEHCTSCHAVWKQEIVDGATWDEIASAPR